MDHRHDELPHFIAALLCLGKLKKIAVYTRELICPQKSSNGISVTSNPAPPTPWSKPGVGD